MSRVIFSTHLYVAGLDGRCSRCGRAQEFHRVPDPEPKDAA